MDLITVMIPVLGALITILLGIIAFFLKNLHAQLHDLDGSVKEAITKIAVMEERTRNNHDEQNGRFRQLEYRVTNLENWRNASK